MLKFFRTRRKSPSPTFATYYTLKKDYKAGSIVYVTAPPGETPSVMVFEPKGIGPSIQTELELTNPSPSDLLSIEPKEKTLKELFLERASAPKGRPRSACQPVRRMSILTPQRIAVLRDLDDCRWHPEDQILDRLDKLYPTERKKTGSTMHLMYVNMGLLDRKVVAGKKHYRLTSRGADTLIEASANRKGKTLRVPYLSWSV